MTDVMNTCDSTVGDFGVGGATGDEGISFQERFPKLTKRLPSIIVEPTESGEVESGELRWPPDDLSSPEGHPEPKAQAQAQAQAQALAQATGQKQPVEDEQLDRTMGGVSN